MAVITYNNYLRQLLSTCECILAFDTATDSRTFERAVREV